MIALKCPADVVWAVVYYKWNKKAIFEIVRLVRLFYRLMISYDWVQKSHCLQEGSRERFLFGRSDLSSHNLPNKRFNLSSWTKNLAKGKRKWRLFVYIVTHSPREATRLLVEMAAEIRNENSLEFGEKRNLFLLDPLLIFVESCVFKVFQSNICPHCASRHKQRLIFVLASFTQAALKGCLCQNALLMSNYEEKEEII